jgi:TRAP-type mannitol/chloroaromatic compound transport system substrate-binding protein
MVNQSLFYKVLILISTTFFVVFSFSGCSGEKNLDSSDGTLTNTITWTMVTTWPPGFPILGEGCQLFSDLVYIMSDGALKIKVYGSGELIPALEVFDAVRMGSVEMGSGAAYYWAGKVPAAQYFGAVPFGMNAQQLNAWLFSGGGLQLWEELYEQVGLIPFPAGNTGVQMAGWFKNEIASPQDLNGLRMRIPGLGGKVLEKMGGAAVLTGGAEIFTNLERGVIDASEWIGPYHDVRMGFNEIAPIYHYPGWHEPGSILELIVNKEAFETLSPALQAIIRAAAMQTHLWVSAEFDHRNALAISQLDKEGVTSILPLPNEVLIALREKTAMTLEELRNTDSMCLKIHNAYFTFYEEVKTWTNIGEATYYPLQ